jgi:hypothetical protein
VITNYMLSNKYLSTSGVYASTMLLASQTFSSDSTTAGNTIASVIYSKPKYPKSLNQVLVCNPSTIALTMNIYTQEIGLSSAGAIDYCLLDSVSINGSTSVDLGKSINIAQGLFNGSNSKFDFVSVTSGTSDSTSVSITMAIKEYY